MRCREYLLSHRLLNKHIWKKKGIAAQCLINRLKLEDTTKTSISTHMIDSREERWDTTYIMKQGRVAAVVEKNAQKGTKSLEDIFFEITEGTVPESGV